MVTDHTNISFHLLFFHFPIQIPSIAIKAPITLLFVLKHFLGGLGTIFGDAWLGYMSRWVSSVRVMLGVKKTTLSVWVYGARS